MRRALDGTERRRSRNSRAPDRTVPPVGSLYRCQVGTLLRRLSSMAARLAPVSVPVVTTKAGARARELTQRTVQSVADVLVSSDREPEVTSSVHRHPVGFTDVLGSANTTLGKLAPSRGVGLPPLVSVIAVPPGEATNSPTEWLTPVGQCNRVSPSEGSTSLPGGDFEGQVKCQMFSVQSEHLNAWGSYCR